MKVTNDPQTGVRFQKKIPYNVSGGDWGWEGDKKNGWLVVSQRGPYCTESRSVPLARVARRSGWRGGRPSGAGGSGAPARRRAAGASGNCTRRTETPRSLTDQIMLLCNLQNKNDVVNKM